MWKLVKAKGLFRRGRPWTEGGLGSRPPEGWLKPGDGAMPLTEGKKVR